jgi:hypothetical protein
LKVKPAAEERRLESKTDKSKRAIVSHGLMIDEIPSSVQLTSRVRSELDFETKVLIGLC